MMRKATIMFMSALCMALLLTAGTFGQTVAKAPAKDAGGKDGAKAEEILKQMADFYGKLPAFSCKVESVLDFAAKEQKNNFVTKMTVRLERPNRLAMIVDEGVRGITVVSDGKQLTQFLPIMKRYAVREAPADFTGINDIGAPMPITMLGATANIFPTSGAKLFKDLMEGVTKSEYIGQEKVGEVMCHRCRFIQEDFDWDIWIEDGKQPLVHKVSPNLAKQLAGAGAQAQDVKLNYVVTFTDWNLSPKFTAADFAFTPPADAEKVDSLLDEPDEPPHPLLGKPAPPFATQDVDGHPIDLKKHLGKNVIMLDFWATWCGPCVQAMPQVDGVAKKFADKGLVFYGVNAGEDAATIKEFLKTSKLEVPVALDTKNEIGPLYAVEGIPQTVLIGKDGTVQVVHVGYSGELSKLLTKEIEALLAGKDLATAELAKKEEARKKHGTKDAPAPPSEEKPADKPANQ